MKHLIFVLFLVPNFLVGQIPSYLDNYTDIEKVAIGKDGYWVATPGGLLLYDISTGELCDIFNRSNSPLQWDFKINLDRAGTLYVSIELNPDHHVIYRYNEGVWTYLQTDLDISADELVFDEHNNYFPLAIKTFESHQCGSATVGHLYTINAVDGETYTKYYELGCGGSSSGCGCWAQHKGYQKLNNGNLESIEVTFNNFTSVSIDINGNFWELRNNILTTKHFNGQIDDTARDTIENDTLFVLHGINSDNKFKLYKKEDGFYLYDGSIFEQITPPFPGNASLVHWNDHNQIIVNNSYVFIDNDWRKLLSPFPFSIRNAQILNAKGTNTWMRSHKEYLLITDDSYFYFNPQNSPLPDRDANIVNAELDNQIWLFYNAIDDESSLLLNHNGEQWLVIDATVAEIDTLAIDKIVVDSTGTTWFLNEALGFVASYNEPSGWQNYNNTDAYESAFASNIKWSVIENNIIQKTINGDTTLFSAIVDGYTIIGNFQSVTVNQNGHGWLYERVYDATALYQNVYYFDGTAWSDHSYLSQVVDNSGAGTFYYDDQNIKFYSYRYYANYLPYCEIRSADSTLTTYYFSGVSANTNYYKYHHIYVNYLGTNIQGEMHFIIRRYSSNSYYSPPPMFTVKATEIYKVSNGTLVEVESNIAGYEELQIDNTNKLWWMGSRGFAINSPLTNAPFHFSKQDSCDYYGGAFSVGTLQGGRYPYQYQWSDGASLPRRYDVTPGAYECTLSDDAGNVDTFDFNIEDENQIVADIFVLEPTTTSAIDGEITTSISGGTPPYTFQWNTGATESDLIGISNSIYPYTVTITDAGGCEVARSINLNLGPKTEIEILQLASCPGSNDAVVAVHFMSGMEIDYIIWNNSIETGDTLYHVEPGILKVTGIDIYGNLHTNKITIPEPESTIEMDISVTSDVNGSTITPIITGGTAPFQYEWNNGSSNEMLIDVSAGNYAVTVTDSNGCIVSDKTIMENSRPTNAVQSRDGNETVVGTPMRANIYPNPTREFFIIEMEHSTFFDEGNNHNPYLITLKTQTGQLMHQQTIHKKGSVNMIDWPNGIYVMTIQNGSEIYTEKIVKY